MLLAERDHAIWWRPAPDIGTSLGESRSARFRLEVIPVEGGCREVKQFQEGVFVGLVLLLHLPQHEDVAAEEELVRLLRDFDRRVRNWLAVGIDDGQHRIALAVLLDSIVDPPLHGRIVPPLEIVFR